MWVIHPAVLRLAGQGGASAASVKPTTVLEQKGEEKLAHVRKAFSVIPQSSHGDWMSG